MLWELQAITAVVVGGTRLQGGVGRVWGTIGGALILEVIGNIMVLSNFVSEYLIGAVQGAIIIIAMLVQRSLATRPVRQSCGAATNDVGEETMKKHYCRLSPVAALAGRRGARARRQMTMAVSVRPPTTAGPAASSSTPSRRPRRSRSNIRASRSS